MYPLNPFILWVHFIQKIKIMKIIADSQRQLNYHPLMIYFMLTPQNHGIYAKHIDNLNKYNGFTRGLFKFRAMARGSKYCVDLSNDLKATLKNYNVIVRLMDDLEGNYYYALGKMNFSLSPDKFETSLQSFIIDVCEQNIKNLNSQLQAYTGESDESKENINMVSEMVQIFRNAIMLKGFRRGVWKKQTSPESYNIRILSNHAMPHGLGKSLPPEMMDIKNSIYNSLSDTNKEDFNKLMAFFESKMDVPNLKESDKYAQGAIDHAQSEDFSLDKKSRNKPSESPHIKISIAKVTARILKREIKKAWGMEISIDGSTIPVYIGSTPAAMVYICTLLKQKMGTHLYREAFKRPLPDKNSPIERHKDVIWLEQVYEILYPGAPADFDNWYLDKKKNSCQFINQGKSEPVRQIKACLYGFENALPFCIVETCKKEPSYFYIDIPADCIIIPKEMEKLIND